MRFLSRLSVNLSEGDEPKQSWITLTRTGSFTDPRYGRFEITSGMLLSMVKNFDAGVYGQEIFIDVEHEAAKGAAATVLRLAVEGNRLRALVSWTPYGLQAVRDKKHQYLSAEYWEDFTDNEAGNRHGCLLVGAALTTRPVIKNLDPVKLSEATGTTPVLLHPELASTLLSEIRTMWEKLILKLAENLKQQGLPEATITLLCNNARKALSDGNIADANTAQVVVDTIEANVVQLASALAAGSTIQLSVNTSNTNPTDVAAQVSKQLADLRAADEAAAKQLSEARAARTKVLSDAINAATALDEPTRTALIDKGSKMLSDGMGDDQVKQLGQFLIESANENAAAKQLAAMGFRPAGSVHVTVDDTKTIDGMQAEVDKRLSIGAERKPNAVTAQAISLALRQFDQDNGARLLAEHRALAGGVGSISDIKTPAIFERTVLRESLYNLTGLNFVDFGTATFAAQVSIPYSWRDASAAGINSTRTFEAQGIKRAGVKQDFESAYPLPQKLAFQVSQEMMLLSQNGQIDFDVIAENSKNATRIIGEDTERLIFNELIDAADEFGAIPKTNEALTGVNGTNTVFVLSQFPVVRPRVYRDLKGAQIGSTLNPVTFTYAGAAKTEWDGTGAQSAGVYWVMNYNQGEVMFVDQAGTPIVPPNATAIVATAYSYTSNTYRFDTDLGASTVKDKWDDFIYRFSLRKNVIEDQRYYRADLSLMSGTTMTAIEQAGTFLAAYSKPGTDLTADGNLGRIKNVPAFKTTAPGLRIGDQRVLIGERNQTRFRLLKPWGMEQLQDSRDSSGLFTAQKEAFGTQWIALHTPTQLKNANTSITLYSGTGRVNRVG
ncbi:phage protease [Andreprevotia sp. IGB-42]|uniref:phage protease n=1 Tax=Andreprevotia sp. IGB-42 TaxID=2497473 RepID=UPI00135BF986|nr:phage protease [Andreprevotia sp. IGB-42]